MQDKLIQDNTIQDNLIQDNLMDYWYRLPTYTILIPTFTTLHTITEGIFIAVQADILNCRECEIA